MSTLEFLCAIAFNVLAFLAFALPVLGRVFTRSRSS